MTRIAILSDIHGSHVALQAALADLRPRGVDTLVSLGDVGAGGPEPRQVIATLRELNAHFVMGNMDAWMIAPRRDSARDEREQNIQDILAWGAQQITADDCAFLQTFRNTVELPLDGGATLLCFHGSPRARGELIVAATPEEQLALAIEGTTAAVLAGGHTHVPLLRRFQDRLILNPGSVGAPFVSAETQYRPAWAEYAIVDSNGGSLSVELRRVPYDLAPLFEAARTSGMPHAEWWIAEWQADSPA